MLVWNNKSYLDNNSQTGIWPKVGSKTKMVVVVSEKIHLIYRRAD